MKRVRRFCKVDRLTHRNRVMPSRVFRVRPDPDRPFHVEVRIAGSRRRMREEMGRLEGAKAIEGPDCMGLVRSYYAKRTRRDAVIRPGGMVARMFLNVRDLRAKPGEIVSHECTHAGMAWARLQRADLKRMPGEEVLCYAVGRMVAQINRIGYAHGVWR